MPSSFNSIFCTSSFLPFVTTEHEWPPPLPQKTRIRQKRNLASFFEAYFAAVMPIAALRAKRINGTFADDAKDP
jgi:hypothetical protein